VDLRCRADVRIARNWEVHFRLARYPGVSAINPQRPAFEYLSGSTSSLSRNREKWAKFGSLAEIKAGILCT
jgi:hypothetical protein